MSISDRQRELVQQSFADVLLIAEQAAELFYNRLFQLDPTLRTLFKNDLTEQQRKLMLTLQVAVTGLDKLDALVPVLQSLAVRHVDYGVRNEHYATVGQALLWTLAQGLGDAFTPEVEEAWSAVYGLMSTVMIQAAEEAFATVS